MEYLEWSSVEYTGRDIFLDTKTMNDKYFQYENILWAEYNQELPQHELQSQTK